MNMRIAEQSLVFAEETLVLTNQRAIYRPEKQALILSDLHLGKAAHYRRNGIALPAGVSLRDLQRLEALIRHYEVWQVIVVGDLVHAGANGEVMWFGELTRKFPDVDFLLIEGNHDRIPVAQLKEIGIRAVYERWESGGIRFEHRCDRPADVPVICGHMHPGVRVLTRTGTEMRFPCYITARDRIVLPAFSLFTGLDTSVPSDGDVCYGFHEEGFFIVA